MYSVYKHTFKETNKCYIGYTKFLIIERLKKHHTNAMSNIQTKFYRAIRKYGIESISSEILFTTEDEILAKQKEIEFIKMYDSFKKGYNMTLGGDGGDIISCLTEKRKNIYLNKIKHNSYKENNGRYCGKTDDECILLTINEIINKQKVLSNREWIRTAKEFGYPQSFSKNRFNGNFKFFIECIKNKCNEMDIYYNNEIFVYKKTLEHRKKLSHSCTGKNWFNDGKTNFLINSKLKKSNYIEGRL